MSSLNRDELEWLETYFIMFDADERPTLAQVERTLKKLKSSFELRGATADDEGRFEALTVLAPSDQAAIDISFESGEEVLAMGKTLHDELRPTAASAQEKAQLARLTKLSARLDLMHFGRVADPEETDDSFDPGGLIVVLEAMVKLTKGVGVDPQSGTLL